MIRPATEADMEPIVQLWLKASIKAHDFISRSWWEARAQDMRELYLPLSDVLVVAIDDASGELVGFAALIENVLAALFVLPGWERRGIGSRLLELIRKLRADLCLTVYERNCRAVTFYTKHGFVKVGRRIEEATGQAEWVMALRPADAHS
ncbi:MAG TPA: GNAT family N-acetyltransferase [Candidatus Avidesulfovibrio excrementigallinarum]|nr:GNAT family N-acetyltransferase [Candidatus Avidesulfovibrio excrementigallinarum]